MHTHTHTHSRLAEMNLEEFVASGLLSESDEQGEGKEEGEGEEEEEEERGTPRKKLKPK